MLWYKTWLENRTLFMICLAVMPLLVWYPVYSDGHQSHAFHLDFMYAVAHGGFMMLSGLWLVAMAFLTMGGLLREQAVGASAFTLALPFSRARLMGVRIAVILLETMTLVGLSSAAIYLEERELGAIYPLSQIWFHLVLLVTGGLVFFGIALLVASSIRGEYTAPLVSFCAVIGIAIAMRDLPARDYSPFYFMSGGEYFDRRSGLLLGAIPWREAGTWVMVSLALLAASIKAVQAREF